MIKLGNDILIVLASFQGIKAQNQPTGSHASNAKSVDDAHEELEKEDKEEDHEVHGAVVPKCFVAGSEPTHV